MKFFLSFCTLLLVLPMTVLAVQTETYGWEDGNTVLGYFGNANWDISTNPVHGGSYSLEYFESPLGGTPQVFVCWVKDLSDGDTVAASFWVYDTTPGASPSGRLWMHWNDDPNDPNVYNGSPGLGSGYSDGTGWSQLDYEWTVSGGHTGIMVEARIYSSAEYDVIWVDDLAVEAPDGATIVMPNIPVALQRSTWGDIKASF